jgi:hypothetical protein
MNFDGRMAAFTNAIEKIVRDMNGVSYTAPVSAQKDLPF